MQGALEKTKKTTYFKLTLPYTRNELKVAIWASGTPEQFLVFIHTAAHAWKQMRLDADFKEAKVALKSAILDFDIARSEYSSKNNKPRNTRRNSHQVLRLYLR